MSAFIKIGNFSGYLPELYKMSEIEFMETHKGINNAKGIYRQIQAKTKEHGYCTEEIIEVAEENRVSEKGTSDEIPVRKKRIRKSDNKSKHKGTAIQSGDRQQGEDFGGIQHLHKGDKAEEGTDN